MDQQINIRAHRGLKTQPNRLTAPEGTLLEAAEVDPLRENVISLRRGFDFDGAALAAPGEWALHYRRRLILHVGNRLLVDEHGDRSSWLTLTGVHEAPEAGARVLGAEAAESFWMVTKAGVMKLPTLDAVPELAGIPQGLDLNPSLTGTGGVGFFLEPDSMVGYRSILFREDVNGVTENGAPSQRETIASPAPADVVLAFAGGTVTVTHTGHGYLNGDTIEIIDPDHSAFEAGGHVIAVTGLDTYTFPVAGAPPAAGTAKAGKRFNVVLDITVPWGALEGDVLGLYRTELSATEDDDPGDRHLLVERITLTAGHIAAGVVAFTDTVDDAALGEELETNTGRIGLSQAAARPPWAKFIIEWKDHVWYGYTRQPHQLQVQLLDVAALVPGSTITISGAATHTAYVAGAAEDPLTRTFKVWTTASTLAENIRRTARSICRVVNRDTTGPVLGFYVSGVRDKPGKISFRRRDLNVPAFYLTANSGPVGAAFDPALPTTGTAVGSSDDLKRNGLLNARALRPSSVPLENTWLVGSDLEEIRGLAALDDALLIFTSAGTWFITGDTDGGSGKTFRLDRLDPNLILRAPYSLARLDNAVLGFFTTGPCRVTSGGASLVARAIEYPDLLRTAEFPSFDTIAWGVAYDTEHKYLLFTQRRSNDAAVKIAWAYNALENEWGGPWSLQAAAGVVLPADNRLYLLRNDVPRLLRERKTYSRSGYDHSDETWDAVVLTADTADDPEASPGVVPALVTRVRVTYAGEDLLGDGWLFRQGTRRAEVLVVEDQGGGTFRLTLDRLLSPALAAGSCTLTRPIDCLIRLAFDGGNAAALKQATEAQIYCEDPAPRRTRIGFQADTQASPTWLPVIVTPRKSGWGTKWGTGWGTARKGTADPVRTKIPASHHRHRILYVLLRYRSAHQAVHILQVSLNARIISSVTQR